MHCLWSPFFLSLFTSTSDNTITPPSTHSQAHTALPTCSCCCLASSICCLCFSSCEAAIFFCSSWAARSCSLRLISWPIMVESWRSFSSRDSGVPGQEVRKCYDLMAQDVDLWWKYNNEWQRWSPARNKRFNSLFMATARHWGFRFLFSSSRKSGQSHTFILLMCEQKLIHFTLKPFSSTNRLEEV